MGKKKVLYTLYIEDMKDDLSQKYIKSDMIDEFDEYKVIHKTTCIMDDGGTTKLYIEKLKDMIQGADVITFDYGGFQQMAFCGGGYSIVDWWNRFFLKQIEDNSGKDWRCISGLNTFEDEDKERLEKLGVKFRW